MCPLGTRRYNFQTQFRFSGFIGDVDGSRFIVRKSRLLVASIVVGRPIEGREVTDRTYGGAITLPDVCALFIGRRPRAERIIRRDQRPEIIERPRSGVRFRWGGGRGVWRRLSERD